MLKVPLVKGTGQNSLFPSALEAARENTCWESFQALPRVGRHGLVFPCMRASFCVTMIPSTEQQVKEKIFKE